MARGKGIADDPWVLNTPLGSAQFEMHRDETKQVLHCQVGSTWLHYQRRSPRDAGEARRLDGARQQGRKG